MALCKPTLSILVLNNLSLSSATVLLMLWISTAMHKDAMASLAEQSYDLARTILKSDDEVDRFSLYILRNLVMATKNERMFQEIGLRGPSDSLSYRVAVPSIERVVDHAAGICVRIHRPVKGVLVAIMTKGKLVLRNSKIDGAALLLLVQLI